MLQIENLSISYGEQKIIENIHLHVMEEECIGIVGPSGCGKTQSMLAILGLLGKRADIHVTEAIWKGKSLPILDPAAMRHFQGKEITMIFQNAQTALDPVFKIKAQFIECLRIHQNKMRKEAYSDAKRLLEKVHIPDPERILESYPHQLSLGTCQRIVIALALCCQADLWILDEPTSALDTILQAEILELLREIRKSEHKSMILITHDIRILPQMCDRIYVMDQGTIIEECKAEALYKEEGHHPTTIQLCRDILFTQFSSV